MENCERTCTVGPYGSYTRRRLGVLIIITFPEERLGTVGIVEGNVKAAGLCTRLAQSRGPLNSPRGANRSTKIIFYVFTWSSSRHLQCFWSVGFLLALAGSEN